MSYERWTVLVMQGNHNEEFGPVELFTVEDWIDMRSDEVGRIRTIYKPTCVFYDGELRVLGLEEREDGASVRSIWIVQPYESAEVIRCPKCESTDASVLDLGIVNGEWTTRCGHCHHIGPEQTWHILARH